MSNTMDRHKTRNVFDDVETKAQADKRTDTLLDGQTKRKPLRLFDWQTGTPLHGQTNELCDRQTDTLVDGQTIGDHYDSLTGRDRHSLRQEDNGTDKLTL